MRVHQRICGIDPVWPELLKSSPCYVGQAGHNTMVHMSRVK